MYWVDKTIFQKAEIWDYEFLDKAGDKMSGYIEKDDLGKKILRAWDLWDKKGEDCYLFSDVIVPMFVSQPTADVIEVVHGEWQVYYDEDSPQDGIWKCSICGYVRLIDDISPTNYCPNCGADMQERREDG